MGFEALVRTFLLLLERRQLARLEAELWKFAEALDQFLHDLFDDPQLDWRGRFEQFLAGQEAAGRIATPEGRQSLRDYLRWWAITIGLEEPGAEPEQPDLPDETTAHEEADGDPTTAELLMPFVDDQMRLDSLAPPFGPQLPPPLEWKPRVVKIERLKGFWDDYRELLASGQYEQGWWESIAVGFTSALLPSSEPSIKITFDDGTVLFVLGGGPDSGALAGQAAFFLGVRGAVAGAATLRQAVVSAFKHLGRETAEHIADNVVQEVTGLPVGPTGLLPRKSKAPKPRSRSRPSRKPRQTKKVTKGGTYLLRDPKTGRVMRTGRSKNLSERKKQLARDPKTRHLEFEVDKHTDDYFQQRGREQIIHEEHRPPMNQINPIYAKNPNRQKYLDSAKGL